MSDGPEHVPQLEADIRTALGPPPPAARVEEVLPAGVDRPDGRTEPFLSFVPEEEGLPVPSDGSLLVIFSVLGVCFLGQAWLTWSRRERWDRDRARWRGPFSWMSGQRELNFQLAMGVLFLGIAVFVL
ncbi:hypothetical protein ACIOG4_38845 [Streptomyces microflavus]|uniref:hypothetical protein n=1 Tax=Streptomyces microflavus TaxID=1919 RepID=UPI0038222AF7